MTTEAPKRPATIFAIGQDLLALDELLTEAGGEVTPETEAAIDGWFAELMADQAKKLDGCVWYLKQLESNEAAAKAVVDQFQMHARVEANKRSRLRDRVRDFLIATNQLKAETTSGFKLAVQKNGGKTPMEIDPDATIPAEYLVQPPPHPDMDKIYAALKDGQELPFAKLCPEKVGCHLRIR